MSKYSRITTAIALCLSMQAAAVPPDFSPLAPGYFSRAGIMEYAADYIGAADQLIQGEKLQQELTTRSFMTDQQAISLIRTLLLSGDVRAARTLCDDFMRKTPASPMALQVQALLADSYFFTGEYEKALSIYTTLPLLTLPSPSLEGTTYRMALSMLATGRYNDAANSFAKLLADNSYNGIARFYLAYIYYVQEDYRRALTDFRALPADIAQEMGADFYIAQMLFAAKQYQNVLGMEQRLTDAASRIESATPAITESYRLLGESAHHTGQREQARAWLTRHTQTHPSGGELSARYILGIYDYDNGAYSKSSEWLLPVAELHDDMGQSALLYLGQAAARLHDYSAAAIYFDRAARMNCDPKVSETALYDYAAAIARGGNVPFGNATSLLEEFVKRYPDSPYAVTADEYLATGYYREHRYEEALERIGRIQTPSTQVKKLRQLTEYALGADLLSAGRATEAKGYLQNAASSQADPAVSAAARLWLGDCLYRMKDFKSALTAYDAFLAATPRNDAQRPTALYNKGYALFQLGQYNSARQAFEAALGANLKKGLRTDATLRVADCQNFTGNVSAALETYRRAAGMNDAASDDYATFQAANMLGVLGRNAEKAAMLEELLRRNPDSSWCSSALAELAEARQAMGDLTAARSTIDRLKREHPDSEQLRAASLSLADALADKGRTSEAIQAYEELVRTWPTSTQARVAAENLQSICTEQGELQRYLTFIKSVPGAPQPDPERVAALAYQAAVTAVEKKPSDLTPLENYVRDYPKSSATPDALVELADRYFSAGMNEQALAATSRILADYPDSHGVPSALIIQGAILAEHGDKSSATQAYSTLLRRFGTAYARQAYAGLMNNAPDADHAISYADKFLALPDIPASDRTAALILKGEALTQLHRYDAALSTLSPLASDMRSATGGKAAVMIAEIYLAQNAPGKAEKLMTGFTAGGCDDLYWLARGYIALADAYTAQGRKDLARQYLEALQQNYPDTDNEISNLIGQRLTQLK